jgi:Putative peptidoglycan binding domain
MRKRRIAIAVVCIAAAGGAATAVVRTRDVGEASKPSTTAVPKQSLAKADKRDLTRSENFDGRVGHGTQSPLKLAGNGTLTGLPAVGDVIEFGHQLAEVDGEPVLLLQGDRPAWRELGPNTPKGEDIRQLEAALVTMGYADPAKLIVDDKWTTETTAAVKAMQGLNGMPVDGRLDTSEIVFSSDVVRIARIGGTLGDGAGAAGLEVSGLDQSVQATVKSSKLDLVPVGAPVTVTMPTGEEVDGTVDSIGASVVAEDGSVTFPVDITTDVLDVDDGITVDVEVKVVSAADAIAVPAEALLALAEGGYAVEVPDTSTATGTRLVPVKIGEFADGWVQVTGDVKSGDQVVVP